MAPTIQATPQVQRPLHQKSEREQSWRKDRSDYDSDSNMFSKSFQYKSEGQIAQNCQDLAAVKGQGVRFSTATARQSKKQPQSSSTHGREAESSKGGVEADETTQTTLPGHCTRCAMSRARSVPCFREAAETAVARRRPAYYITVTRIPSISPELLLADGTRQKIRRTNAQALYKKYVDKKIF